MSSQRSSRRAGSSSEPSQRTFLDDVILTFSSPMAWVLVVALIITWSAVAVVLFDLLDYKTLAGLPPPAVGKRVLRTRGGVHPSKSSSAGAAEVTAQGSSDWLELMWSFCSQFVGSR
ncbi:triadin-like isoform X3 [Thalassophryne amazonica]|uniref:triadin-like isoform X3 n=1 Tax=Thalassophryne amazonica TaxID=390379 RepID=UPI001471DE4B|nr:triadin-like isoform X3 [Thalassophryne amazonica]